MTETVTGTITAVAGTGKSFQLDSNDWYGVYDESNLQASRGDVVTFDFVHKGKWKNVKGKVTGVAGGSPASGASSPSPRAVSTGGRTFPVRGTAPERTINRQNALTNAVKFMEAESSATEADIIKVARVFEAYTCGDDEVAEGLEALNEALAKISE